MKKTYLTLIVFALCGALVSLNSCSTDEEPTIIDTGEDSATSFATDIKPIISINCSPCHVDGGANTNYTTYINASNSIDLIITRINLEESNSSSMPLNMSKLSQAELDLIAQWKTDGLKE